ncbi:hypothetical protein GCM10010302_40740 [Streptomyces polychromogenes]|uniref:Uncharacterized protein n=1 Tax=Streptomyces polychromogenes TaxID=67342 RepID=A0ABN0VG21_9ACTN
MGGGAEGDVAGLAVPVTEAFEPGVDPAQRVLGGTFPGAGAVRQEGAVAFALELGEPADAPALKELIGEDVLFTDFGDSGAARRQLAEHFGHGTAFTLTCAAGATAVLVAVALVRPAPFARGPRRCEPYGLTHDAVPDRPPSAPEEAGPRAARGQAEPPGRPRRAPGRHPGLGGRRPYGSRRCRSGMAFVRVRLLLRGGVCTGLAVAAPGWRLYGSRRCRSGTASGARPSAPRRA